LLRMHTLAGCSTAMAPISAPIVARVTPFARATRKMDAASRLSARFEPQNTCFECILARIGTSSFRKMLK